MRRVSSLVMAGTLLESVVLQIVEAAVGLRPLRLGHAGGNDEVAAMGAVEPGGQRDFLEHDVDPAHAHVRGQLRLLALVAGPGGDVPRGGEAALSPPLVRGPSPPPRGAPSRGGARRFSPSRWSATMPFAPAGISMRRGRGSHRP